MGELGKHHSLFNAGADLPCRGEFGQKSVDLLLKSGCASPCFGAGESILCEVKWTRQTLKTAMEVGYKSFSWLQIACRAGRWSASRKPIKANLYGCLVVKPTCWELQLRKESSPSFRKAYKYPASEEPVRLAKGRSGKTGTTGWPKYRKGIKPGHKKWPSGWDRHNKKRRERHI